MLCLYFRSLVCTELLFPWIQDLPDQLVQLGNSNPRTSGIIIGSISIAALHTNTSVLQPTVESIFSKWSLFLVTDTVCDRAPLCMMVGVGTKLVLWERVKPNWFFGRE